MHLIVSMVLGFLIDLIVGDPHGLIHPVQIIGWFITKIKEGLQRLIYGCSYAEVKKRGLPRKRDAELLAGYVLTVVIVLGTFAVITGILYVRSGSIRRCVLCWRHSLSIRFSPQRVCGGSP